MLYRHLAGALQEEDSSSFFETFHDFACLPYGAFVPGIEEPVNDDGIAGRGPFAA
jgi:hypothetical protein